jgi:holo-[acyl-carrier protein] synthase
VPTTVGIDLIAIDEVSELLGTHGERYLKRVYTDFELLDCCADPRRLASRFAAKEATMKALGRREEALPWRSIGVRTERSGALSVQLTGEAAALARRKHLTKLSLSIAQRRKTAAAIVLAEFGWAG